MQSKRAGGGSRVSLPFAGEFFLGQKIGRVGALALNLAMAQLFA